MSTISVSVPASIKEKMALLDEVNWSAVARKAFEEKIREIEFLKEIADKSKLTEKDAKKIGDKINKSMSRRFEKMYEESRS